MPAVRDKGDRVTDAVEIIGELFASEGAREYLGEPVSQAEHMLQAAELAEGAGASPALVAAALLHDVGHFTSAVRGDQLMAPDGMDNHHSDSGADWLAQWFGEDVTEPIRLHVAAKRYLCAVEPGYLSRLSDASIHTLRLQGGPMTAEEATAFEAHRYAAAALRLRRWDDAAKDPAARTRSFGYFAPMLRRLLRGA